MELGKIFSLILTRDATKRRYRLWQADQGGRAGFKAKIGFDGESSGDFWGLHPGDLPGGMPMVSIHQDCEHSLALLCDQRHRGTSERAGRWDRQSRLRNHMGPVDHEADVLLPSFVTRKQPLHRQ